MIIFYWSAKFETEKLMGTQVISINSLLIYFWIFFLSHLSKWLVLLYFLFQYIYHHQQQPSIIFIIFIRNALFSGSLPLFYHLSIWPKIKSKQAKFKTNLKFLFNLFEGDFKHFQHIVIYERDHFNEFKKSQRFDPILSLLAPVYLQFDAGVGGLYDAWTWFILESNYGNNGNNLLSVDKV